MDKPSAEQTIKDTAVLTIRNEYDWVSESRLGRFYAYQDGRRVGRIGAKGALDVYLVAGVTHRIQVRFWHWFRSEEIKVTLENGEHRTAIADIDRSVSVLSRMGLMGLHPHRSLVLKVKE